MANSGVEARAPGSAGEPRPRDEVNWPLVLGLGASAGLWPLGELTGLPELIGPNLAALLMVAVTTGFWISWVGFLRVPRPLVTLTLTGTVSGAVLVLLPAVLHLHSDVVVGTAVLGAIVDIGACTALGGLSGVLAWALQRTR
jgi:hypothetical protein